ncbi:peptidyl-prolyl cis-trans isomerase [Enterococcus faecium]|uniref:peptidyl-prolyl cis-trans isomerase n=1 Tax=Enterococcus faecium TaxID=1352 RepID=UPI000A35048B|nr:peptidyl-prolyl cis-trans isomerase [Enterococcus faecium]OTO50608.1 hypothetical protein A5814_002776 [Enterococcus faecium]
MDKKKLFYLTGLLCLSLFTISGCNKQSANKDESLVSGKSFSITRNDFQQYLIAQNGEKELENLIEFQLLKKNYSISSDELEKAYNAEQERFTDFDKELLEAGKTKAQFKFELEKKLLTEKAIRQTTDISDPILKQYYQNWKPTRVITTVQVTTEEEANKLKEELNNKQTVESYLSTTIKDKRALPVQKISYSEDTKMDETIREKANQLKQINEVSGPIQLGNTYYLLQLEEAGEKTTFEKDKGKVKKDYLEEQMTTFNVKKIIDQLFKSEEIKINDPSFPSILKYRDTSN